MKMKPFLLSAGLLLSLWACQPQPKRLDAPETDSSTVGDTTTDAQVTGTHRPVRHPHDSVAATTIASSAQSLMGLKDMSLQEAMEMDDFRGRLEHDWGDVHAILLSNESVFQQEGPTFLVAKGENKQGGFLWSAILIVDLHQDAIFAAQYDGENKVFNQFEEEKEGLQQPAPLTAWTAKYR
jgi:hypothetical protein